VIVLTVFPLMVKGRVIQMTNGEPIYTGQPARVVIADPSIFSCHPSARLDGEECIDAEMAK
jgi:hypothetical protein